MFGFIRNGKLSNLKRFYSNISSSKYILEPLNRSLIRVNGQQVSDYLQGLITNDINHLSNKSNSCMYTMFLNTKGRILYDAIIYKFEDNETYYIECDDQALEPLQRHLQLYRVRRKISVDCVSYKYQVYSLFNTANLGQNTTEDDHMTLDGGILCSDLKMESSKLHKNLKLFKDPRVRALGFRVITDVNTDIKNEICDIVDVTQPKEPHKCYKSLRYGLGIGEGLQDHPVGASFALECNCDYLHGVSFHKGCYIGQELTARIHHTGVVRKRLMPLFFTKVPSMLPKEEITHDKVSLGKFRGIQGNVGLALLRINEVLDLGEIPIGDGSAKVRRPAWWPVEATKAKIGTQKN